MSYPIFSLHVNLTAMFHLDEVLQLKDTENVKTLVRRHPITLLPGLSLSAALIVLPFFFLFPLFNLGIVGVILFLCSVIIGVIIAGRTVILWDADVLIVTTIRLVDVDQRGVFSRFVTEIPIATIQEVSWKRQGVVDTIFKIGTLSVQAMHAESKLDVHRVAHPAHLSELIGDLRNATTPKRTDLAPDLRERLRTLTKRLEELSPEALDRVEQFLKSEGKAEAVAGFLKHDITP